MNSYNKVGYKEDTVFRRSMSMPNKFDININVIVIKHLINKNVSIQYIIVARIKQKPCNILFVIIFIIFQFLLHERLGNWEKNDCFFFSF